MTTITPEQEARELLERAKRLPKELRYGLANELLYDCLPDSDEEAERVALKAELTRRWERLRSGEEKTRSIDDVIAALRQQNEARKA